MRAPPIAALVLLAAGCNGALGGDDAGVRPDAAVILDAGATDAAADGDAGTTDAAAGTDAGGDAGGPDLCGPTAGSLIDGSFDDGLDGLTPPTWQVRDPAAPGRCGDPAGHVYSVDPPLGCPGRAIAIDAHGDWDCYAIQVYTDYDTIEGGRTYLVSAVARSVGRENPGGWFFLGLQWLDGSDRVFGDERNPMLEPLDFEWRRVTFDVVAPAEARRAVVWLTAHYDGRMDFDDVAIAPAP